MTFQELKQRHREERDAQHENLRLRIHRALSWLQRAEMADDEDGRFIFLWIAFNASYATEPTTPRGTGKLQSLSAETLLTGYRQTHRRPGLAGILWQHQGIAGQSLRIPELLGLSKRQNRQNNLGKTLQPR